jgi:hypothetical protein
MNKLLSIIFAFLVFSSFATAQTSSRSYFGVRLGFPELGVQLGNTAVFGRGIGGRLTLDFGAFRGNELLLGGDILAHLPIPTPGSSLDLEVYVGGGAAVGLNTLESNLAFNVHLVLGLELLLNRSVSVFLEARPVASGNTGFSVAGAAGLNLRL